MTCSVDDSYAYCQQLTKKSATNFYYSFMLLSKPKRRSMYAIYAFLRHTDDLGDDVSEPAAQSIESRRAALVRWRESLERALAGQFDSPVFPALADTVARFRIPPEYLQTALDGVMMDLDKHQYETFAELCDYCHKVAVVVGLACIHIWGFRSAEAFEPASKCGLAFQLTNILRDLKEDAAGGRIYLPQEDLRRFEYTADDLQQSVRDGRFTALMRFEISRAEQLYREAAPLAAYLDRQGRAALGAMVGIYRELLEEIKRRDGDVFTRRVRLSRWRKFGIAARCFLPPVASLERPSLWGADPR